MKLPAILSGPILRRVEKHQVYIWIATSRPFKIDANLYEINGGSGNNPFQYDLINNQTNTTSIQLGKKLYIHLIKTEPQEVSFPTETLLGYNLFFLEDEKQMDLGSEGLLSPENPESIVYEGLEYPSFYITEKESPILYGSCRKPHGDGEDALAAGDEAIWETYLNLENRPGSLFLVGDQIYADDVPDPIAPYLFELGIELIGHYEPPLSVLDDRLEKEPYKSNLFKVHGRKPIMDELCHFTSRKSDNHLITFGEYTAMYLLSWSPQVWDLFEKSSFKKLVQNNQHFFQYTVRDEIYNFETYTKARQELKFDEQVKQINNFRKTLPQVRRLLANIPTYMIFDDHDLTDDWNISQSWKEGVWQAPLGRHVIANGLAAYWAFQGWGNSPEQFDHQFLSMMKMQLSSKKFKQKTYDKWTKLLWEFNSWSFIAPTTPTTVFLDTRTQRTYPEPSNQKSIRAKIKHTIEGPELLSEEAWKHVTNQLKKSGWKQGSPLVVVSPVPFYGIDLIETFLHNFIAPLKLVGIPVKTLFDMEGWKYNGRGFTRFLRTISQWNPSICIILSGEAHTASSTLSHIYQDGRDMTLIQFTSSPLNNPTFSGLPGLLLKSAVWFFENNSRSSSIYRSCDAEYSLYQTLSTPISSTQTSIWSEEIRYLPLEDGDLIKTKNNLGYLSFYDKNKITNNFIESTNEK
ncbi:MAG: hypothetical protein ACQEXB_19375 [Bacillota bacterium]